MDKHGRRNGYSDTVAFFWKIEVEAARYAAAREVGDFDIVMVRAGEGCPTLSRTLLHEK